MALPAKQRAAALRGQSSLEGLQMSLKDILRLWPSPLYPGSPESDY